jgi:hypothetical protein
MRFDSAAHCGDPQWNERPADLTRKPRLVAVAAAARLALLPVARVACAGDDSALACLLGHLPWLQDELEQENQAADDETGED